MELQEECHIKNTCSCIFHIWWQGHNIPFPSPSTLRLKSTPLWTAICSWLAPQNWGICVGWCKWQTTRYATMCIMSNSDTKRKSGKAWIEISKNRRHQIQSWVCRSNLARCRMHASIFLMSMRKSRPTLERSAHRHPKPKLQSNDSMISLAAQIC